jgi:hypothetical protein
MSVAAVVLAHRDAGQVLRLARRLECDVWVHWDAKSAFEDRLRLERDPLVKLVADPVRVHWGDWSPIAATMKAMRAVRGRPDHLLLLSGQTYPIRPPATIRERLSEPLSYVRHLPLPIERWSQRGGIDRVRSWWFRRPAWAPKQLPPMVRVRGVRRTPPPLPIFGGSQWMVLHRRAYEHLLTLPATDPVLKLMRRALLPDELFIQTTLANSPLRDHLVNDDLHHIKWSGGSHPEPFEATDLPTLHKSSALFARKFAAGDPLLDSIDRELLGR